MLTLALELSTPQGSIALANDEGLCITREWNDIAHQREALFSAVESVMKEAEVSWEQIDFYTVGRGPGSFSGLRVALAVANAFALSEKKPVYNINSGYSLACAAASDCVVVLGDARRQQCWMALFRNQTLCGEYELVSYDAIGEKIPANATVISPDFERLKEKLSEQCPTQTLIEGDKAPHAKELALAMLKLQTNEGEDPLYMHPPVFVKPKYTDLPS